MRAAILSGPGELVVESVPDPEPAEGEVLIRTEIAAICGSDLHGIADGPEGPLGAPGAPGHEAIGYVVESQASGFPVGTRVLCTPPAAVARCFADLQVLPVSAAVPVPEGPAERLVLAQQLGTAVFAMKRFWPPVRLAATRDPQAAVVTGVGPAGLAFVQLLRRAGFEQIIVSDLSLERLKTAEALGATTLIHAPTEDVVTAALDLTGGEGVELAIEAAGTDATRHQVMRVVRDEGRIGLFGLYESYGMSTYPLAEVFRRRATIDMTWNAQMEEGLASFAEAVDLVSGLGVSAPSMISHTFDLEQIDQAVALAADPLGGACKVAVSFS